MTPSSLLSISSLSRPLCQRAAIVRRTRDLPSASAPLASVKPKSPLRCFSRREYATSAHSAEKSYQIPAKDLDNTVSQEELSHYEKAVTQDKDKQIRTPWHREGSDKPPVARNRSAGAMTKGKLLTTPSRLLKLILPLTTTDSNTDRKSVEPLALLVHPQQPLSYLERLIQSELPLIPDPDDSNKEKIPAVNFLAEDASNIDTMDSAASDPETARKHAEDLENAEEFHSSDGETERTGKIAKPDKDKEKQLDKAREEKQQYRPDQDTSSHTDQLPEPPDATSLRGGPGEGGVESYSGAGREGTEEPDEQKFVRWSKSTEIGDFIRDAARGQELAVSIEGAPYDIRVGVPSFNDRTYYLRMRLRKKARQISQMADVKRDCDMAAHAAAQRVAYAGFAGICGWGYLVYYLTFLTDLGWDVMEPVTYLVGLAGIMIGYAWFLLNRREVSYQSAMNLTVSRRQSQLYQSKGFDLQKWQALVEDANALRREIRAVASEYDVEWDERADAKDEKVVEALKKHREEEKSKKKDDDDKPDD